MSRAAAAFKNQIERVIGGFVQREVKAASTRAALAPRDDEPPRRLTLEEATRKFQLAMVRDALEEHRRWGRWNVKATASSLGVSRSFLYQLIGELERTDIPADERKRREPGRRASVARARRPGRRSSR